MSTLPDLGIALTATYNQMDHLFGNKLRSGSASCVERDRLLGTRLIDAARDSMLSRERLVENDKDSKNKEERVITCYEEYVITNE